MFSHTSPSFSLTWSGKSDSFLYHEQSAPSLPKCHLWIHIGYVTLPMSCDTLCEPFLQLSYTFRSQCHIFLYCACGEDLNLLSQFGCCQPLPAFIPIKLLKHASHSVPIIIYKPSSTCLALTLLRPIYAILTYAWYGA